MSFVKFIVYVCVSGYTDRFFPSLLSFVVTESLELQTYPAVVVDKMLKALKLHSSEARLKFPRLLQIVELYPEETLSLMTKEVSVYILMKRTLQNLKTCFCLYLNTLVCAMHILQVFLTSIAFYYILRM